MNQQIKEQWVAALRSGDYQQTRSVLRDGAGFCCLGVLSDLYLKEKGKQWEVFSEDCFYFPAFNDEVLPNEVMDWADLGWENPEVTVERFNYATQEYAPANVPLSDLNDTDHDFKMIAALIEEQL
jgi:hypothetical protein